MFEDAVFRHQPDVGRGIGGGQQFLQFAPDPFRRQPFQLSRRLAACGKGFLVGRAASEPGMEAKEPQQPQHILGDAFPGRAHESHPARAQVRLAALGVVKAAVGIAVDGVDGEVAAHGIGFPVVGEGNLGVAAIGLHVMAQGGHLERLAV